LKRGWWSRLAIGATALLASPVIHAVPADARSEPTAQAAIRVEVRLAARGYIVAEGTAVVVPVAGICTAGAETLEAFVTVSQEGVSSGMGSFPLRCDGTPNRYRARVEAFDGTFTPGAAFGSAYALIVDPDTGQTDDGGHSRVVTLIG
jgi:hypothetical protein